MSDAPCQAADGLHLLGLEELFLEPAGMRQFFVALLLGEFALGNFSEQGLVGLKKFGGAFAHAQFHLVLCFAEQLLSSFLLGDVSNGTEDQNTVMCFKRAQTDFHGEFAAVFP